MQIPVFALQKLYSVTFFSIFLPGSIPVEAQEVKPIEEIIHHYQAGDFEGMPYRFMILVKAMSLSKAVRNATKLQTCGNGYLGREKRR